MSVYAQVLPLNGSTVSKVGSATKIDIVSPDKNGTSYNRFSSFDALGVVINNARENVESKLIGGVKRNPALSAGTANAIVLDNVGDAPMRLGGLVEIAGDRADLLMVGRNGIVCNSCGFINTGNLTLGSGTVQRGADGTLSLQTGAAGIGISGAGLSAPDANIALVAQQIDLLAPVYGKDVAFHIVKGLYGVDDQRTASLGEAFDARLGDYVGVPNVLADGQITLYTNARKLDATNLTLSATGKVDLRVDDGELNVVSNRITANEGLTMQARTLDVRKTTTDSRRLRLQAEQLSTYGLFAVADEAQLTATRARIEASSLDSLAGATLRADELALSSLKVNGDLAVTADNLTARALDGQGGQGRIRADHIRLDGGQLAYGTLDIENFSQLEASGSALRANALSMTAAAGDATVTLGGGTRVETDALALRDLGSLDNAGDITLREGLTLADVGNVNNRGRVLAGSLSASRVRNLRNSGDIRVDASELDHVTQAENRGRWTSQTFSMTGGRLDNEADLSTVDLAVRDGEGIHNSGRLSTHRAQLERLQAVSNQVGGSLSVQGRLQAGEVARFENQGQVVAGRLDGTIDDFDNRAELALKQGGRLQGERFASTGKLYVGGDELALAQQDLSLSGALQADRLALRADTVTLRRLTGALGQADIAASGKLTLDNARLAGTIDLRGGEIESSGGTSLSGTVSATAGQQTYRDTEFLGPAVALTGEAGTGAVAFENVRLKAEQRLDIQDTQSLTLNGGQLSGGALALSGIETLRLSNDTTLAFETAALSGIRTLENAGQLGAQDLSLADVGSVNNTGKLVAAREAALTRVAQLDNAGEMLLAGASGQGNGSLDNQGSLSVADGTLTFANWQNRGRIAAGPATLAYTRFVNAAGASVAGVQDLTLAGQGSSQLENMGLLGARQDLALYGPDIRNAGQVEVGRDLTLGRPAGDVSAGEFRFVNQPGTGSVAVGRDMVARVDNFVSKARFASETLRSEGTEYAPSGTYGTCQGSGHGSCRTDFNAAGGASVVWYGSGFEGAAYGLAGRNGATVSTITTQIKSGSFKDAPIRVGGDLQVTAQGGSTVFDTHAATLQVGGRATFTGVARRDTNAYTATQRVQKNYFTDTYRCWSDVACVNSYGNNKFHARERSRDGLAPTDVTRTVSTWGGLRKVALASLPEPAVELAEAGVDAALLPAAVPPFADISTIATGARQAAPADIGEERPGPVIVAPSTPQAPLRIRASDFLFPSIPGELTEAEKLPVVSDTEERGFDVIRPLRLREDHLGYSCHEVAQSNDATTLTASQPRPECRIELHFPEPRDS